MKKIYLQIFLCLLLQTGFSQTVILGTGTSISAFSPFTRAYEYNVYEVIYPGSEILIAGTINRIAFERVDGTDVNPIDSLSIYMQHTALSDLVSGTFDTTGYTLVYQGTFPNDAGSGWREVTLTNPFAYDGLNNLQVLVTQGYQVAIANTPVSPRWYYTTQTGTPARRYWGNIAISSTTQLNTTTYRSNAKLDISSVGVVELGTRKIDMFPNPATEWLQVENLIRNGQLTIFNSLGESVFSTVFSEKAQIKVAHLPEGIYHVLLNDSQGNTLLAETFIKN